MNGLLLERRTGVLGVDVSSRRNDQHWAGEGVCAHRLDVGACVPHGLHPDHGVAPAWDATVKPLASRCTTDL